MPMHANQAEPTKTTRERLYDLFVELGQLPNSPIPTRKIAIISTPRCGSKFFCYSLASTGRFGRPLEWMNVDYVNAYARVFGLENVDLTNYFQFVLMKTTSGNGVFALNFHVQHYLNWRRKKIDLLSLGYDKIYYLYRKNKFEQAISLAKARLSDQWSSRAKPVRNVSVETINNSDILAALYDISRQDEYYKVNLAKHVQREYCYEDFTASDSLFRDVLTDNGIEHQDIQKFTSGISVQRAESDAQKIRDLMSYLRIDRHCVFAP